MSYDNYSVYDFVMDESFKEGVKAPDSEAGQYWEEYYERNPDQRATVNEARQLIKFMNFERHYLSSHEINASWRILDQRIEKNESLVFANEPPPLKLSFQRFPSWQKMAAVFIGLMMLSTLFVLMLQFNGTTKYVTDYGETKTIILPDNSTVTINANSTLEYKSGWDGDGSREVWLDGEAFFSVVHTTNHQRFIVNTSDLGIEVLGTEFNVNNRRRGTKVVLNSGKVKIKLSASPVNGEKQDEPKEVMMKPGELVEYSEGERKLTKKEVDVESYTAWRDNKLVFEDTPLNEIVQILKDNYGLEVMIENNEVMQRKFTATYPADNVDVLLNALSKSFNMKMSRKENQVVFKDNE